MKTPNRLIGKTLTDIQLDDDKTAIRFVTTEGDVFALCEADCCSHTWVEAVESTLRRLPALVLDAKELDLQREDEEVDYEVIQFYGFKIVTDQGEVIIDYRNSSNGYYGGDLAWMSDAWAESYADTLSGLASVEGLTA